jgi:hypothetical protein
MLAAMAKIFRVCAWASIVLWVLLVLLSLGLVLDEPDPKSRLGSLVVAIGVHLWLGLGGLLPTAAVYSLAADTMRVRELMEWWDLTRAQAPSR